MAVLDTDALRDYSVNVIRTFENGELGTFVDPAAPTDLGTALTQDQIDSLKILLKEIGERFATGGGV